jgi:hypothetical protein
MRNGRCAWMLASVMLLLLCSGALPVSATRATGSQPAGRSREVVVAVQRNHCLHVFDAGTLEPLGRITGLHNLLEHVSVSPDGRTLYLAQAATFDGNGCCALFEFNLLTGEMCHLIEPAMDSLPSPDGRSVFTQRGGVGIDVFDTRTLARTTIATFDMRRAHENRDSLPLRGHYALHPSSDGRWMFGITLWQKPSLGIFDLRTKTMVRELTIPAASGAWVGNQFYLYENNAEQPHLFAVTPEATDLGPPRPIVDAAPGLTRMPLPARAQLLAAGDRLLAYQPAATWMHNSGDTVRSGIFVIDPVNGALTAHLAPSVEFAQLIVGAEGQRLYGLDAGGRSRDRQDQPSPRLMALDARTGAVVAERALTPDVWHLAIATVPASVLPLGDLHPTACRTAR